MKRNHCITLLLTIVLMWSICGCSHKQTNSNAKQKQPQSSSQTIINRSDRIKLDKADMVNSEDEKNVIYSDESLSIIEHYDEKQNSSTYFLSHRDKKDRKKLIRVENIDTYWGNIAKIDDIIYLAAGLKENAKESSIILEFDIKKESACTRKIKGCNTIFSSVKGVGNTLFIWYMNEEKGDRIYHMETLNGKTVGTWTCKEAEDGPEDTMMAYGSNSNNLFCYLQRKTGVYLLVYNENGELEDTIDLSQNKDLMDFQKNNDDIIFKIYCAGNQILMESLNNQILFFEYKEGKLEQKNIQEFDNFGFDYTIDAVYEDVVFFSSREQKEIILWDVSSDTKESITHKAIEVPEETEVSTLQNLNAQEYFISIVQGDETPQTFQCNIMEKSSH